MCFRVESAQRTCAAQAWVGRTKQGVCPSGALGLQGRWALRADAALGGTASHLCRYGWSGESDAGPDAVALDQLSHSEQLNSLEPDCEVVAPSADAIDVTWPALQQAFYEQTDRLETLPFGQARAAPVRVEIIDSAITRRAVDGEPSIGQLAHGRAMGLIVRKLACPSGGASCRAEVASTLALPLVATPLGNLRDYENGGYFGSQFDLAIAIGQAVASWQSTASDHRLVINLSLGWEPQFGGEYTDSPDELRGPVRAVWNAIARARCLGAAVVVAAGNRPAGPDGAEGLLYPAAWSLKMAPTAAMCQQQLGIENVAEGYTASQPLVFAVGGVEPNDADLSMARKYARTEILAPAAHAVVEDTQAGGPSVMQTGTSVAAAVTSAAAAVIWSYRPDLSANEVMDMVYEGGADVGRSADVCYGGGACDRTARRVSICGALKQACASGAGGCPSMLPACEQRPGGQSARPKLSGLTIDRVVSAKGLAPLTNVGWPCNGRLYTSPSASVENPCPASQLPSRPLQSAVGPQPGTPPVCPHCEYNINSMELFIEIDEETDAEVGSPVLAVVVSSKEDDVRYFDLSPTVSTVQAGEKTLVTDLDIGADDYESATIEFMVDGEFADRSPVISTDD